MTGFRRVAWFEFDPALDAAAETDLHALLASWPAAMPWLGDLRFGRPTPVGPQPDRTTLFLLTADFTGPEPFAAYQRDPAHLALRTFLQAHRYQSRVFDLPSDTGS